MTNHTVAAKATITFFLFQMAKLDRSISIYSKAVSAQNCLKLTCEAQSVAKLGLELGRQNPRDRRLSAPS